MRGSIVISMSLLLVFHMCAQCPQPNLLTLNDAPILQANMQVSVIWSNPDYGDIPSPPDGYLYFSTDSGRIWEIVDHVEDTSYTVEYIWTVPDVATDSALIRVVKYDHGSCWDQSELMFSIESTLTTTSPHPITNVINVFPNPAKREDQIHIRGLSMSTGLAIYNLQGILIYSVEHKESKDYQVISLSSENLEIGFYILVVFYLNEVQTTQFVVIE
jgi:type IX secretion system substrate protein